MVMCDVLLAATLVPLPRQVEWQEGSCPTNAAVREVADAALPPEGYRLDVRPDGVRISSSAPAGAFYARQTLAQLAEGASIPCCTITDGPAYPWRGFLLDEGRHFFGKETVRDVLDLMAAHKLNVFHWHLTEDQGWRIDVPGLPELVRHGSVRPESPKHGAKLRKLADYQYRSEALNGVPYGPFFYSEADLREIVAYAQARHIKVVPEIDLPGHALAILAAYPELACFPENIKTRMAWPDWGIFADVLCVGNDKTLEFLFRVLDFVCEVFPSDVIHIGGDECPFVNWAKCPKCQARMKREGLKEPKDLQAWITTKVAAHLAAKGRRVMGWDEILAGDIPVSAIGQSWRTSGENGAGTDFVAGAAGVAKGHDMVMTPTTRRTIRLCRGSRKTRSCGMAACCPWRRRMRSIRSGAWRRPRGRGSLAARRACGASTSGTSTTSPGGPGHGRARWRRSSGRVLARAISRTSRRGWKGTASVSCRGGSIAPR